MSIDSYRLTTNRCVINHLINHLCDQILCAPEETSHPWCCGEHVFVLDLKAVHLLQDHFAVLLCLEEVRAADDGGDSLGLVSLDQHRRWGIIGFDTPRMGENESRKKVSEARGEQQIVCETCLEMCAVAFLHVKKLITSIGSQIRIYHKKQ